MVIFSARSNSMIYRVLIYSEQFGVEEYEMIDEGLWVWWGINYISELFCAMPHRYRYPL